MKTMNAFLGGMFVLTLCWAGCDDLSETALSGGENCINAVDDNGDGKIDCEDPDCAGIHAACSPMTEYDCFNGVDDDGDGRYDCDDSNCTGVCTGRETSCIDNVDNDQDGLTDCRDSDCANSLECKEKCDDLADNDGDGFTDCADPDCFDAVACLVEDCGNNIDDDKDGKIDCDDLDCADLRRCQPPEICNNGVDDDADGTKDCDDPDCTDSAYCFESQCNDGIDNDLDKAIDCDDDNCATDPSCKWNQTCNPHRSIGCNMTIFGTTRGRRSNFKTYPCVPGAEFKGGERYYIISSGGPVTVTLEDLSVTNDLQLFGLLSNASGADVCSLDTCTVASSEDGKLILSIESPNDGPVWIAVDSAGLLGGAFTLSVACEAPAELNCDNRIDDDGDGAVDCWDSECYEIEGLCNYWVDAGTDCESGTQCLVDLGHFCAKPEKLSLTTGFCSRPCETNTDCVNDYGLLGHCLDTVTPNNPICVMLCGSDFPGHDCPLGWDCTDIAGGSTAPKKGICVPPQYQ